MTAKHTELYLEIEAQAGMTSRLAPLLSRIQPASVLIVPPANGRLEAQAVLPLVAAVQQAAAAAIIADDARLARTVKADGVHLGPRPDVLAAYGEAREIVGSRAIVGADAGRSRHDAMSLGEAGADYVAFRRAEDVEGQLELVSWWSDIFEVPCVGLDATTPDDVRALMEAGADFVGFRLAAGVSLADEQALLMAVATVLAGDDPSTGAA
jgi:thiamine-phosphate pyrophosphorylase